MSTLRARSSSVAVISPYWEFWESSTRDDLRASRDRLLATAVERIRPYADVGFHGLIDSDSVDDAIRQVRSETTDGVVIVQTMATPPAVTMRLLDQVPSAPLIVWAARDTGAVLASFGHSDITTQGASVGTPMLTSMLVRQNRPFDMITGAFDDPTLDYHLENAILAAATSSRLSTARIGRVGQPIEGYECVDLDPDLLRRDVGATIIAIAPEEFRETFLDVDKPAVESEVRSARSSHRIADDVNERSLELAIRSRIALERLVSHHRLDAGALNCHVPEIRLGADIGIAPCFALGCLTSSGIPWTCSGDVVTAVAMLTVKLVGGAALYHELEAYDARSGVFVVANSGEHDVGIAPSSGLELVRNSWFPGDPASVCARISPQPGPATLVAFAQVHGSTHRLIVARGEFGPLAYPNIDTSNASFRFNGDDARESWESWCRAGSNHHGVLSPGDLYDRLRRVTSHGDMECTLVDPAARS